MGTLKAGSRVQSAVCMTEVMVVQAPTGEVDLRCGGAAMIDMGTDKSDGTPDGAGSGTQIGKRYTNEAGDLELLCTKPGDGSLAIGDVLLQLKEAKALPSSD